MAKIKRTTSDKSHACRQAGTTSITGTKSTTRIESEEKKARGTCDTRDTLDTSSREPQTMDELLSLETNKIHGLKKGQIVDGVVTEITSKTIFIDIGAKTEGVVLGKEFEREKDFIKSLKPGDKVRAYVGNTENQKGQILVSLRQAASAFVWDNLRALMERGEKVEVKGREVNKGGLIVDALFSLQGFVPGSQIGSAWQGKLDQLVGRKLAVKIIEVNREQNRLVFSEKVISDAEKIEKVAKAIKKLKLDDIFEAEITQIAPFGIFVKVKADGEEVEGLVHISEVSWQKIDDLSKLYQVKEKIKVKVVSLEDGRVQFSIKKLQPDPWEEIEKKCPIDGRLKGKVVRLTSFGALVEIEPGIEGLVHISKIPPEFSINEGDKIDIYIESIDRKGRRISLGLVLKEKPIGYK